MQYTVFQSLYFQRLRVELFTNPNIVSLLQFLIILCVYLWYYTFEKSHHLETHTFYSTIAPVVALEQIHTL